MSINPKADPMRSAILFQKEVLFTPERIPKENVPDGWYCYELRGSVRDAKKPTAISDHAYVNRIGSVLSPVPLKRTATVSCRVNGQFLLLGTNLTLKEFCRDNGLAFPVEARSFKFHPASPEDVGLFYAQTPERDAELGAIGHVRIDFGRGGKEFYHSWWPRGPEELNTQEFKDELEEVVNDLRKGILKDLSSMRRCCYGSDGAIGGGICCQNYGFTLETERYLYRLRCNPTEGDYQAYLSCFVRQEQELGLTEQGRQRLRDAADPSLPHSYDWYVMEACNTPEEQFTSGLSLEDAIQRYTASENERKRLGVTKDDIAAVDLVIRHDGREWVSEDWTKSKSFAQDPAIADAAAKMRKLLEEQTPNQGMTMEGM